MAPYSTEDNTPHGTNYTGPKMSVMGSKMSVMGPEMSVVGPKMSVSQNERYTYSWYPYIL